MKNHVYWTNYREALLEYTETNRSRQNQRNKGRSLAPLIARSDALSPWPPPAGLFQADRDSPLRTEHTEDFDCAFVALLAGTAS